MFSRGVLLNWRPNQPGQADNLCIQSLNNRLSRAGRAQTLVAKKTLSFNQLLDMIFAYEDDI